MQQEAAAHEGGIRQPFREEDVAQATFGGVPAQCLPGAPPPIPITS